jgi:hypothetical protein
MTKIAILPVENVTGNVSFLATKADKHTEGKTAGKALDALTAPLSKSAYHNCLRSIFLGRGWPSLRLFEPPLSQFWERGSVLLIRTACTALSKIKAIRGQQAPSPSIGRRGANGA